MTQRVLQSLSYVLVLAACLLSAGVAHAQKNAEALKHARSGYELEQQGQLSKALYEYNAAIAADPKYPYPLSRIATMYQRLRNYPLAIQFFNRALALDSSADVYMYYNLGLSYLGVHKHDSAVIAYQYFLRRMEPVTPSDSAMMRKADGLIKFNLGCIAERAKPKNTDDPLPLPGLVNSPYDDFGASITADGETLYFTSRRPSTNRAEYFETKDYGDDLFVTHKDTAGKWGTPKALPLPINSADDEGSAFISADGQALYYSLCRRPDGFGECDLYLSELAGDSWTRPQNLGVQINSQAWDAQPSLTPDGNTMYFSSRRPGSIDGSEDIWVAYRNTDRTWGKPVNLGEPVNTELSERTPFIAADGRTLYFSSNGHPGLGNHDLFVTHKLDDGSWSVPTNLGAPINGEGDDVYLTIPARGTLMYYSSQRNDPKKDLNIYQVKLPDSLRPGPVTVVAGMVYDSSTHKPLGATIEVTDLKTGDLAAVYHTNILTGKYFIPLGTGKTYGLTASAPKYTFHSEHYTVPDSIPYKEISHDIALMRVDSLFAINEGGTDTSGGDKHPKDGAGNKHPIDTTGGAKHPSDTSGTKHPSGSGPVVALNNIFFDFNKATLRPESIPELKNLLRFLRENPQIKIEVEGHTDSVGTDAINLKLSQARAEAVRTYLLQNGVAAGRLTAKGFGSSQPVASNATEEGRQKNRRTEFKINN